MPDRGESFGQLLYGSGGGRPIWICATHHPILLQPDSRVKRKADGNSLQGLARRRISFGDLEPDVDAGSFPVVGLIQNVRATVAIEIGDARFVKADASGEFSQPKMACAIAIENPSPCIWIVRLPFALSPFGHFRSKDIDVAVAIDVSQRQRMAVNDISANQIAANP